MSKPWQNMASEIDLPRPVALWVITAHILTIIAPVIALAAVAQYERELQNLLYSPKLLSIGLFVLIIASVCESAQNTLDRWYLTEDRPTLLDCAFNTLVVVFMCLTSIACRGDLPWVAPVAIVLAAYYPVAYALGWPREPGQAGSGLLMTALLFERFGDPVVFLQLLTVFLTLYFFHLLLKTHAQSLHGFTTLINGVGLMAIPVAIHNYATNTIIPWPGVALIAIATAAICAALYPKLAALPATPRSSGEKV